MKEISYSFITTFALGIIYYQLTVVKQGGINDRIGLIYVVSSLGLLPNIYCNIDRSKVSFTDFDCKKVYMYFSVTSERQLIYQDSLHNLYPKMSFFIAKVEISCLFVNLDIKHFNLLVLLRNSFGYADLHRLLYTSILHG